MTSCQFENFDITITGDGPPYSVLARFHGLEGIASFQYDATQPEWNEILASLADPFQAPGESFLTAVGGSLFDELIQGGIRDLWVEARSARQQDHGLRIRLALHPPGVAALPWETLADPRGQQIFAADPYLSLVRVANLVEYVGQARPLAAPWPLTLLIAAPDDEKGIDAAQEIQAIQEALTPLGPHVLRLETLTGRFGPLELQRRVQAVRPEILHIISHGEPDGLYLWSKEQVTLASAAQIGTAIQGVDSLRLVFLNACLAGQADDERPYASLAHRLLQTGAPAVIAMQFEIADQAAAIFAAGLYRGLVAGDCPGMVDVAVNAARRTLYINDAQHVDYITPVLWLNVEDGVILHLDAQARQARVAAEAAALPPPPPPIALHIDEKERWLASLPERPPLTELRFDYLYRRDSLDKILRVLRKFQTDLERGAPVDMGRARRLLEDFEVKQREMDALLARLNQGQSGFPQP